MSSDKFLRGAMILTLAGLMVKVIGSVNRILLSRLLGGEGIGLYQMAYPVYLLLLAISAAGIPVAISIIVAGFLAQKDYANVRQVFRVSLRLMACVGAVLAVCLVLAAGWLVDAGVITDVRAYYSLIALTPAIFFATILASFRGYFQGHQLMTPPAVSQIVEQFIRVVTMVVLAYVLLPYGLEYAAAGAAFGAVPGSLTGLVVMGCFYRYYRKQWQVEHVPAAELVRSRVLIKRLLLLALPVSCANILVPVTSSIDVLLVPGRLIDSGLSVEQATAQFGYLAGMAQPLLLMATIPTMSLATSLVPAVSEAFALNKWQIIGQKAATAMKLCCLITVPASVGMWVLAEPISCLLYGTAKAGVAIMHSAPAICLLGLQQVTTGMLQGMGHTNLPMLNMLIGIAAKLVAVLQLTNVEYGIAGAAWATNINFGVTALLNIIALYKFSIRFSWLSIAKIIAAAAMMGAVAVEAHVLLGGASPALATIAAMLAAGISYIILLPLLGVLNRQELRQLPVVKRFFK
ncbi:putative polysaccharide biosynthesis protein [Phascolarctobacterium succinatutens]|uniref:putative polysaccharide biosynthesis protein n=1 Tax=Phascolarctobacterium succinatutens TaxID=626940 RepID=UPI0026E9F95E|nr:polysaccharide biosynthesis protein [Phascolarctobacterium succinatutens]